MSQITTLLCLFCQHLNPSDADYCKSCDGQLNLRPCERCDAVDLRTAKNCYKCGAKFSLLIVPGLNLPFTPAIVGKEINHPNSTNAIVPISEAERSNAGLIFSHLERRSVDEAPVPQASAAAVNPGRGTPVAFPAILLLLITTAVAVYLYRGSTAQPQGQDQPVIDVSGARKPEESSPSNGAAATDAASKPVDTVQKPPASPNKPEKKPSEAPLGAGAAPAARPLPATDAQISAPRDPLVVEKCPPAVATLGLCNPDTQLEKP